VTAHSETSAASRDDDFPGAIGSTATVKLVTTIVGTVIALTFLFGFGNVLALGLRLGVPIWIAPLNLRGFR